MRSPLPGEAGGRWRFGLLLLVCIGLGQSPPAPVFGAETAAARERLAWADSLFLRQRAAESLALLDSLLASPAGRPCFPDLQLARGRVLATIGQGRASEAALRAALAVLPAETDSLRWARLHRWLAVALELQGRRAEVRRLAATSLASALRRGDEAHEAYARLTLAYDDLQAGDLEVARIGYERSLVLFERLGNRRFALIALTGLGRCHNGAGDFAQAAACYARVAEESRLLKDPFSEGHALNNLGTLMFALGDPAAALGAFRRAYALHRDHGNPEGCIIPAKNTATALTNLGRFAEAAAMLEEALRMCAEEGYAVHRAMLLEQLGNVRRRQGRLPEAAAHYRASLTPLSPCSPDQIASSLMHLAQTLAEMDSCAEGLALLAERVAPLRQRLSTGTELEAERVHGELFLASDQPRAALLHFRRAESLARRFAEAGGQLAPLALAGRCYLKLAEPDSAMALLQRAVAVWERARTRSQDPEWREQWSGNARQLFADLAQLQLAGPAIRAEADREQATFALLQRFKARTLRERLLGPAASGNEAVGGETLTAAHLQGSLLKEGELLLDAFVGPDSLLLFAVDRRECRVLRPRLGSNDLEWRLQRLREVLTQAPATADTAFIRAVCQQLGRSLLGGAADLLRRNRRILYSPDGALNLIPLAILEVGADGPLLSTHEVLTLPSASLLADLRIAHGAPAVRGGGSLLVVAGRQPEGGDPYPGALAEGRWLRGRYKGVTTWGIDGLQQSPLDPAALDAFRVMHFAAHTRLDDQHPWRSALLLAGAAAGDSAQVLPAAQIAGTRLSAGLAVLAGCESAGGTIVSGEGVLGLSSAFLAAGVPAVLASLWPVRDDLMPAFTRRFYTELDRGVTITEALRLAQLAMRQDAPGPTPGHWAGFLLIGDGSVPLVLPRAPSRRLPLALLALVLLAAAGLPVWRYLRARSPGGRHA